MIARVRPLVAQQIVAVGSTARRAAEGTIAWIAVIHTTGDVGVRVGRITNIVGGAKQAVVTVQVIWHICTVAAYPARVLCVIPMARTRG